MKQLAEWHTGLKNVLLKAQLELCVIRLLYECTERVSVVVALLLLVRRSRILLGL